MDNLDKIKNGDLTGLKKGGGMNLVQNAKQILGDMRDLAGYDVRQVRDRMQGDDPRKNVSGLLPFDPDEAYRKGVDIPAYARAEYYDKYR